jgi:hypothetical protein
MARLRLAPSGPPLVGNANGDLLRWNATTLEWDIVTDAPYLLTEYDHLISTRANLVSVVAPVAGDFLLPSGSYFFKAPVALNEGERIVVDGSEVLLAGGGNGRGLIGNYADDQPWFIVRDGGRVLATRMTFGAAQTARHGISIEAGCVFIATDSFIQSTPTGTQAAVDTSSFLVMSRCDISGGIGPLKVRGGANVNLLDCRLQNESAGLSCIDADVDSQAELRLSHCSVTDNVSQSPPLVNLQTAQDVVFHYSSDHTYYYRPFDTNRGVIRIAGTGIGLEVSCSYDRFLGTPQGFGGAGGLQMEGDATRVIVDGCDFDYVTEGILAVGLHAIEAVRCSGNKFGDNMTTGISWQTAWLPSNGLIEINNQFAAGVTPFGGHVIGDALVIRRGNFQAGTPLGETIRIP